MKNDRRNVKLKKFVRIEDSEKLVTTFCSRARAPVFVCESMCLHNDRNDQREINKINSFLFNFSLAPCHKYYGVRLPPQPNKKRKKN